ncbi:MAG TPA: CoA transferase [Hyphomicrobiaceae bacterium]|jgi:crotonobetainyl-CoA:carnitine CoA-transferase CaiB-like acyl-CoA transferase|nr:CoA transferase [Hyphomicrobiaceae bacterium]
MAGVLEGIRVLDFGRYIAGPYCAALLAEHGAEVIRIEKREGSEDRFQAPVATTGEGALFLQMNRNKLGMTLDPMRPEGQQVVRRLVERADVVIANLPPQTLAAMQLDYASLTAVKPDIILTTVSAYGRGGPYSDRVGFDGIGQVMSGAVYMTGEEEQPYRAQVPWVDFGTALHCAFGTMAALMARRATGKGQWVEGALLATAVTLGNALLIEQAVIAPNRVPTGNRGQTSGPVDIFRTKDGWILVQVIGNPLFARWARLMGEEHWLRDERFKDDISRGNNGAVISERMRRWAAAYSNAEALDLLAKAKIPAGPVLKPQATLEDPHINAVGFLQPTEFPGAPRPAPIAKVPVWLSETPGSIRHRAPLLGEHTDQILAELGYDKSAIAALRDKGVI